MNRVATHTQFLLRLMLSVIVGVIGLGFLFIFLQDYFLHRTLSTFEKQIENDKNRIRIGKYIIEDLERYKAKINSTLSAFSAKSADHIFLQLQEITGDINQELDVIEKGGDLIKHIPLNLPNQDFLIDKVTYHPLGHDRYIEEILVLRVLISDMTAQFPILKELFNQRLLVQKGIANISPKDLSRQMGNFFKKIESQTKRMEESANKIFYDSTIHMEKVDRKVTQRKKQFQLMIILSSITVLIITMILGLLLSKRIINNTLRVVTKEEEKLRIFADCSYDWEEWILADKSYEYISPSCERITGYSRDEFLQDSNFVHNIVHPEDRELIEAHRLQHIDHNLQKSELNFRIIRKDGETCWIWHQCQPLFSKSGVWLGRRTTNRDITSLHIAQRDLKLNEQRLKLALQGGELALWDWDIETDYFRCNHRWFEMLEYEPEEITVNLESWKKRIHPDDFAEVMEKLDKHLQSESKYFEAEYRLLTKSDSWLWVLTKGQVIDRDSNGKALRAVGTQLDTSDRKKKECKEREIALQQEQLKKLDSLKNMAGAIAHRFNNAMMAVSGNLELMTNTLPAGSDEHTMASQAFHAAQGASQVGSMMLTYLGQRPTQLQIENLVDLVRESVNECKGLQLPNVILKFTPPSEPLYCSVDKQQIKEVIESILTNAVESLDDAGGKIEITFGTSYFKTASFPIPFQSDELQNGTYSFLRVKDTGHGISADDLSRIFEPFYTTRFVGRGIGLALSVGITKNHHGAIMVESDPGMGTTVRKGVAKYSA